MPKPSPVPVGQTFGMLTVIAEGDTYVSPKGIRQRRWLCQCECGTQKSFFIPAVRDGVRKSCGCLTAQKLKERKTRTINPAPIGERFGKLVVLAEADRSVGTNGKVHRAMLVRCDCGTEKTVRLVNLRNGMKSCGCASATSTRVRKATEAKTVKPKAPVKTFKPRKKYGLMTYVGIGAPFIKRDGTELEMWILRCDCGNQIQRLAEFVHRSQVTHCGCQKELTEAR